ncbi:hypothetical protein [Methylobacterium radiodurans]|uniref:Uncharacterized protein n=1 Tax=Methylobacterium radiodurans TaxID=2202828 RepID=A0A2U8VS40_9HYPH|nr:hypothetical protein [Methylobacterium radiodurans]AWN36533.1 hypothetical protein DK427_12995 [Methylobacterium radiodurans]
MRAWLVMGVAGFALMSGLQAAEARGGRGGGGLISVRGYTTQRGTYVAPHVKSRPDGVPGNNLSYRPGVAASVAIGGATGGAVAAGLPAGGGGVVQTASATDGFPEVARAPRMPLYECPAGQRIAWNDELDDGFCILN